MLNNFALRTTSKCSMKFTFGRQLAIEYMKILWIIIIIRGDGTDPIALRAKSVGNSIRREHRPKGKLKRSLVIVYSMWSSGKCAYPPR